MAKQITFDYKGKTYTLEFTRDTVVHMERGGFKVAEVADYPNLMLPKLFYGAFRAHHPTVKQKLTDSILDHIKNKDALIDKLSEMYSEPIDTLLSDDEGNVEWEATGFEEV